MTQLKYEQNSHASSRSDRSLSSLTYLVFILYFISIHTLSLEVHAFCGDGVVEENEECDDGNNIGFDTCNNFCVQGLDIEMISIPAGIFVMGNNQGEKDEAPAHLVKLSDNFLMSKTEVTHKQYKACVDSGDCSVPAPANGCIWGTEDTGDHPINCVNWRQAQQFADFVGLRLPTEAEWEYVASGGDQRIYPWGNDDPSCEFLVTRDCARTTQAVCSSEEVPRLGQLTNQRFPICDLAGNIAEWVEDNYAPNYRDASPTGVPFISNNRRLRFYRVLRGGSWLSNPSQYRVTDRYSRIYLIQTSDAGIRLAKSTLCGNDEVNQDFDNDGIPDINHPDFEECDDGNLINGDGCDSNCTITGCGNGIVNKDFDNDGVPDPDNPLFEYCDIRPVDGRVCLDDCTIDTCGDLIIQDEFGEECDNGPANSDVLPNACRTRCRSASCGDGVTDEGEACDEGDSNSDVEPNACRTTCAIASCGDNVIDNNELCDNGDDNSNTEPDACRSNCIQATCGDGVTDSDEQCDDGGDNSNQLPNACRENCRVPGCGDGVHDDNEECDDGDGVDTNVCLNNCEVAECGDGVRRVDILPGALGYEACDDGNGENKDRCLNACTLAFCGDGIIRNVNIAQGEPGFEFCDDGNDADDDGCSSGCGVEATFTCLGEPSVCFVDADQDQIADNVDNCVGVANNDQADQDNDGVGDVCDNCPVNSNADQTNTDQLLAAQNGITIGDAEGDACDSDRDNDGVFNNDDDDELNPFVCSDDDNDQCDDCSVLARQDITNDGVNTDNDILCNVGDLDDDNDTFSDIHETTCETDPLSSLSSPLDTDLDGLCDNGVDPDDDNDNLSDEEEDINNDGVYTVGIDTNPKDPDTDADGIQDDVDNCPLASNQDQLNTDQDLAIQPNALVQGDALGDACDLNDDNDLLLDSEEDFDGDGLYDQDDGESDLNNPDTDGDSRIDGADNCIFVPNPAQQNTDQELADAGEDLVVGDADGDECDNDDDNDGLSDTFELTISSTNPFNPDSDTDGIRDDTDNCRLVPNADQINTDKRLNENGAPVQADDEGDECDSDDDNDTIIDNDDDAPLNPFICQDADDDQCDDCSVLASPDIINDGVDTDGDFACDVGDEDDDNDTFSDIHEGICGTLPLIATSVPLDTDADGLCDNGVDNDDDNDNLPDLVEDADGDGVYDIDVETNFRDADTDDDGVNDGDDNCKLIANGDQTNTDAFLASQPNPLVVGDALGDACDPNDDNDLLTDLEEDINNNNAFDNNGDESNLRSPDTDGDGRIDGADNCILVNNPAQQNTDQELVDAGETLIVGDIEGDACDTDDDNDGLSDTFELTTSSTSPFNPDTDGDRIRDDVDNCRLVGNNDQLNTDLNLQNAGAPIVADSEGDVCDNDDDNDTVDDFDDDDPFNPFVCADADNDQCDDCAIVASPNILNDGLDSDSDVTCDLGDSDDDNDGFSDEHEEICGTLTRNPGSRPLDTDGDGLCDNGVDNDDDDDGLLDTVEDADGDGFYDIGVETNFRDADTDDDGTSDDSDNCPLTPNADQRNTDANLAAQPNPLVFGDALGDACDPNDDNDFLTDEEEDTNNDDEYTEGEESNPKSPDTDGDSRLDGDDNCILTNNPGQQNTDQDLVEAGEVLIIGDPNGDACDEDDDNDGLTDTFELTTTSTSPFDPDHDDDGIIDSLDNCRLVPNPNQINTDKARNANGDPVPADEEGDACDSDDDNDTIIDNDDNAPLNPFLCQDADNDRCDDCSIVASPNILNDGLDTDGDVLCDAGDPDDDNDGFSDSHEGICGTLPKNPASIPIDTDDDGLCDDGVDPDDDNDTISDIQEDADGDGFFDEGDETNPKLADTDGDGTNDNEDNCPTIPNIDQRNTDANRANDPNPIVQGDPFGDACDDNDDNDALTDAEEDANNNGIYDQDSETDPLDPDTDGDFIADGNDNCPLIANADQTNTDQALVNAGETLIVGDTLGDACDTDDDNDGVDDAAEIGFTLIDNPDTDGDNVIDGTDNCPVVSNPDQRNTDADLENLPGSPVIGDGLGDECDGDDDNDQVIDLDDSQSLNPFACTDAEQDGCDDCGIEARPNILNDGPDLDNDSLCDPSDPDDDGDGFSDIHEEICGTSPRERFSIPPDTDQDGLCDNGVDPDDDNDNLTDLEEDANGNGRVDLGETNPRLTDSDSDGVNDDEDNCPVTFNADQLNTDSNLEQQPGALVFGDPQGDVCDDNDDNDALTDAQEDSNDNQSYDPGLETNPKDPDTDDDGVVDGVDNCPFVVNPDQANSDLVLAQDPASGVNGDELGDACDIDDDNDGLTDSEEINLGTLIANPDSDSDGRLDSADNCPVNANADQSNRDGDSLGDVCDDDDDNDNVNDNQDNAQFDPSRCLDADADGCDDCSIANSPETNNDGQDTDGDGICNEGDPDDDNDGFSDAHEQVCGTDPNLANQVPLDTDGDGLCDDGIDNDDDNDTLPDGQEDPNNIGVLDPGETNPKDPDTDDDGVRDDDDNCPRIPNPTQLNTDANLEQQANALVVGDSLGDACDNDDDNDGLDDTEEEVTRPLDPDTDDDNIIDGSDNCPLIVNPGQEDNDLNDGEDGGDSCDLDDDNDGLSDLEEINQNTSPFNPNSDGDNFLDGDDNCPLIVNNTQTDTDLDGQGNACDPDDDNDTVLDNDDSNPLDRFSCEDEDGDGCNDCAIEGSPNTNNDGFDRDGDGLCDQGDPDEDADGFSNIDEIKCGSDPEDETSQPLDTDEDGFCDFGVDTDDDNDGLSDAEEDLNGNNVYDDDGLETDLRDADTDNDGVNDNNDNCPLTSNPQQVNTDLALASAPGALIVGDLLGDECDLDDDNDGLTDAQENITSTNPKDPDSDDDNDLDGADNCPNTPNANQLNSDGANDGGNACDDDDDNDGLTDVEEEQ
jgi:cysteine-rich repeat protein